MNTFVLENFGECLQIHNYINAHQNRQNIGRLLKIALFSAGTLQLSSFIALAQESDVAA